MIRRHAGSAEPYAELAPSYARLRAEVENLMVQCRAAGLVVTGDLGGAVSVDAAAAIAAAVPNTVEGAVGLTGQATVLARDSRIPEHTYNVVCRLPCAVALRRTLRCAQQH